MTPAFATFLTILAAVSAVVTWRLGTLIAFVVTALLIVAAASSWLWIGLAQPSLRAMAMRDDTPVSWQMIRWDVNLAMTADDFEEYSGTLEPYRLRNLP